MTVIHLKPRVIKKPFEFVTFPEKAVFYPENPVIFQFHGVPLKIEL